MQSQLSGSNDHKVSLAGADGNCQHSGLRPISALDFTIMFGSISSTKQSDRDKIKSVWRYSLL